MSGYKFTNAHMHVYTHARTDSCSVTMTTDWWKQEYAAQLQLINDD